MVKYNKARKRLRIALAILFIQEFPFAIYLLFFPYHFQEIINFSEVPIPFFIREVGNFLVFTSYFQIIAFLNPEKNLVAVQLTIVFRVIAGMLELWHVLFILKSYNLFYYSLLFFFVTNFLFAYLIIHYLKKMSLKWIDLSK